MSDELEKLRRKVRELEKELALRSDGGTDPRRRALLKAGVPADRLNDAAAVFRPSGNSAQDVWTLDGLTGPVDSLAREWLSTRPWFGTAEPEVKPETEDRPRIENGRAHFADGSSLDVDMMSADDLLAMAGPQPKVKAPEPKPADAYAGGSDDHLSDVDKDWRDAGTPKAAS